MADELKEKIKAGLSEIESMVPADLNDDNVIPEDVQDRMKRRTEELLRMLDGGDG